MVTRKRTPRCTGNQLIALLLPLLCLLASVARAADAPEQGARCYYFWAHECFEIRNARTRDITDHILITGGPHSLPAVPGQSCAATVNNALSVDQRGKLLDHFNHVLDDIDGCHHLSSLKPEVFPDARAATQARGKLTRPNSHRKIHRIPDPLHKGE